MRNEVTAWLGQVKKACLAGIKLKLAIGRLVAEALKGGYHTDLGYDNMEKWVDDAADKGDFPCDHREAWECLKVVNGLEALKIKDSAVYNITAFVKLKAIFSLSTEKYADKIREMLADPITVTENYKDTQLKVKAIKAGKDVAQVLAESKETPTTPEEAAKKGESAELSKFSFTFTPANAAVVEKALALFSTDRKEALLKMCAAAIAAHTPKAVEPEVQAAEPEKVLAAGA